MLRQELKKRIEDLEEEISNFDYQDVISYKERTKAKLERLKTLFEDLDY